MTVTGTIFAIDREISTTTIEEDEEDKLIIAGFPFGYLEREIAVDFAVGDCVTVEYAIVFCRCAERSKNIAVALNSYCVATIEGECDGEDCYKDGILFRDDDFYPVDKSRHGDDDDHHHHHKHPGKGSQAAIPPAD